MLTLMLIFLLERANIGVWELDSSIHTHRQGSLTAPKHERTHEEFADFAPRAGQSVALVGKTNTQSNVTESTEDFESHAEDREKSDRCSMRLIVGDSRETKSHRQHVVAELGLQLLFDKECSAFLVVSDLSDVSFFSSSWADRSSL